MLLELQEHIPALVVVLEMLDIVEDQHQGTTCTSSIPQCHFFELVEGCAADDVRAFFA